MKFTIIILTHNAGTGFPPLLKLIAPQVAIPNRLIVVDTSSIDDTVEQAKAMGIEVVALPASDFNHGATREMARRLTDAEIVIFMTQDAIPCNNNLIEKLLEPLLNGTASFSYARQVPRSNAGIFEAFPRQYNYPEKSNVRSIKDVEKYGVYTFFCSDSCAAYLNSALDEIGGFQPTLTNEDYFATARLLQKGHTIAYVADAEVEHSHTYNLRQEFRRYFDTGYVRAENSWIQEVAGQAEGRGKEYFVALTRYLLTSAPWLIPYAVVNTSIKLLGYRVGFWSRNAPTWWKKLLSSQKYYWKSRHYKC